MGRCRTRRNYKRDNKRGSRDDRQPKSYKLTVRHNELFQKFYQGLGIVPEGEWDQFYDRLKESLPVSFRLTGFKRQSKVLLNIIKTQYFEKLLGSESEDGQPMESPKCMEWYPDEMGWQLNFSRKEVRSTTALEKLHRFLVSETESGNISRQEAVSMIPPILLDVKPHHKVLDLCAAPGSKTAQLIEQLHADENKTIPDGFVVANDVDNKRCYMMVHQVKRLQSPCCIVINHDAATMPNLRLTSNTGSEFVSYDRVLADVPCSGDGTLRKNLDVWDSWHPAHGPSLHGLQSRILKRGLELLTVGGRLVYSTCSFNPVENEAVVANLLQQCEGALELVDVSDNLKGLKSMPGLLSWRCMSRKGDWYTKYEDVPPNLLSQLRQSMFPTSEEKAKELKLNYCLRVLPHHQNTGGFFIAVMVKKEQLPWLKKDEPIQNTPQKTEDNVPKETEDSVPKETENNVPKETEDNVPKETEETVPKKTEDTVPKETEDTVPKETEDTVPKETEDSVPKETEDNVPKETEKSRLDAENANDQQSKDDDQKQSSENPADGDNSVEKRHVADDKSDNATNKSDNTTDKGDNALRGKRKGDEDERNQQIKKKPRSFGYKEDPYLFLKKSDEVWPPIQNFFKVSPEFPIEQLMYRSETGKKKTLYFVSKAVLPVVKYNCERVKIINVGVKIFGRSPSPIVPECDFRINQEGLACLHQYFPIRRIPISKEDIITILGQENPYLSKLSDVSYQKVSSLEPGSCIFIFKPTEKDPEPDCELIFCGWKGKTSIRSFVGKHERAHYLRLCGQELGDIQKAAQEKVKKAETAEDPVASDEDSKDALNSDNVPSEAMEVEDGAPTQTANNS